MTPILQIDSVQSYNDYFGVESPHPLVSVIDGHEAKPLRFGRKFYHIYTVLLKDADCGTLKYGRSQYDYRRGTMLFIAPGQVMGSEDDGRRTPLAGLIKDYSFFSYNANEGLHLSEQERQTVLACLANIKEELRYPIDKHSKSLIIDNIKLLLDYCVRFYDRQFITREKLNSDILARLETLLDDYFLTGKSATDGLPTVQYCADPLPIAQLPERPPEERNRHICPEAHPAPNARGRQSPRLRPPQVPQRDSLRTGFPLSAALQPLVQEADGDDTEGV